MTTWKASKRWIYIAFSNRKLRAVEKGFVVDTGKKKKHIVKSSELIFDTKINRVIEFLYDKKADGYWIATDTTGLIWSKYPF